MDIHRVAARGYELAGRDYERARPLYPTEAVELVVSELGIAGATVLELGAGTGKLTRLLAGTAARWLAVEPVAAMLAQLTTVVPTAVALTATAEAIPVRTAAVDAVVVGTAFHWFRGVPALGEIARVLAPQGTLGLLWNNPDRDTDWVAAVWELVDQYRQGVPGNLDLRWQEAFAQTEHFTPLQHRRFAHTQEIDLTALLDRVASISFIASLPPAELESVRGRVQDLATSHLPEAGRGRFPLPYRTDVYWCRKRERHTGARVDVA